MKWQQYMIMKHTKYICEHLTSLGKNIKNGLMNGVGGIISKWTENCILNYAKNVR